MLIKRYYVILRINLDDLSITGGKRDAALNWRCESLGLYSFSQASTHLDGIDSNSDLV